MKSTLGFYSHSNGQTGSRPIVLYVDDRRELLKLRKKTLESVGYSVVTATTARTTLTILEHLPVAAVLVEYKSEGLDPEAVAFHVKQKFPQMPVILMSACSDIPDRTLWLVDEYVMRSAPVTAVADTIARATHGM